MAYTINLIGTFQTGKMVNGTFKLLILLTVCSLLVSQTALAWSFWDWIGGKKQQPVNIQKPQIQPQNQQPKAATAVVTNCGKQAEEAAYYKKLSDGFQRQSKAWQKEYELAMNYARGLEKQASEKARLSNRCNTYVYPQCPSDTVKVQLNFCTPSMLPEISCNYPPFLAFNPNIYPYYKPKVCDIVVFDVPPFQTTDINNKLIEINRLTHRIVAITGSNYVTRGDAAETIDSYQPNKEEIKWVVCK